MKKLYHSIYIVVFFFLLPVTLYAQEWVNSLEKAEVNFYEIKQEFESYWQDREVEKGKGYKQFRRWEWYWQQRVSPGGTFPDPALLYNEWQQFQRAEERLALRRTTVANWAPLGPANSEGGYGGIGRINCIAFHPTDTSTFWIGTAGGGLWKTSNGGASWTTSTDDLPVLGVTSIVIDHTNPNIIYIATGDGINNNNSEGVMKSTDGGVTWTKTQLSFNYEEKVRISTLAMHRVNTKVLLAATNRGIFKTTDGGASWKMVREGVYSDLKFNLGDPSIVYACSRSSDSQVFISTDIGDSWEQTSTFTGVNRVAIAVTPADPDLIQAVCSNSSNSGFGGIYTSTNSGVTFELAYDKSGINLLHSSYNGVGAGGQGWYDLAIAISPTNPKLLFVGGINTWKSADGGKSWELATMWWADSRTANVAVVHADKHFLMFHPLDKTALFECNDGGIYKSTNNGLTWQDLSNDLQITQFYRVGVSAGNSALLLAGAQDNGTKLRNGIGWRDVTGGDGTNCLIDYSDEKIMYSSYQNGGIYRTKDAFATPPTFISNNIPGNPRGAWVTPFILDPVKPNILYAGFKDVYKSNDRGDTWKAISNSLSTDNLTYLAVAPLNTDIIYTGTSGGINTKSKVFKTENGGDKWTDITGSLPVTAANISNLSVNPLNPEHVVVTFSGFSAGNKVYSSEDGGKTWQNISGALPNIPVNCSVFRDAASNEVYIGTDLGVFFKDSTSEWQPFNNGLPNVVVTDLKIHFAENKILAATFGRGIWVSDLTTPNEPVLLSFNPDSGKAGDNITITGSNLAGTTEVLFNNIPAVPEFVSATTIKVVVPPGAKTGRVRVVTPAGTATSKNDYIITTVTGIAGANENSKIEVYPNPASDRVRISLNAVPIKEIVVFSDLGAVIKTMRVTGDMVDIPVAGIPAGVYFIRLQANDGSLYMKRFVKL
ncbi:VPS10 domain-containing protein [Botryobacter ruber]|uniref:VPS10 domain-containing protein n=1 Tax=Botryobacter ruber TaxID=2171629 RepID=UPI000E0B464A|nr:IPT/TIG domain-containing protein [Botryobacter ruber]